MAESEAVTPPRLPASTKEHKRNSRFPFRRPVGERGSQQEVDLESGLVAAQGETIEPRGSPRLASSFAEDVDFMVVGRFSYLHTRVLVRRQDEIRRLKQRLGRLDRADALAGSEQRFGTPSERGENHARDWLLKTIDEKLSIYSAFCYRRLPYMLIMVCRHYGLTITVPEANHKTRCGPIPMHPTVSVAQIAR